MALIGKISIAAVVDTKPLKQGLDKSRGMLAEFEAGLGSVKTAIAGLAGAFAVKEIGANILEMTGKAATLAEGVNKLDAVFKDSSAVVRASAESMASQYGIAVNEIVADFGRIGSMLTGAGFDRAAAATMSDGIVRLANDLGRFNDTSFEVAFQKLRSGLAGESEPLRDFGVFLSEDAVKAEALSMGLGGLGGKLSDQAKIQARLNIITKQTADAQGAATREMSGLSSQMEALGGRIENLKTAVGSAFAPAVNTALTGINEILSVLQTSWDTNAAAARGWGDTAKKAAEDAKAAMENPPAPTWSFSEVAGGHAQNAKAAAGGLYAGANSIRQSFNSKIIDNTAGLVSKSARDYAESLRTSADANARFARDWWKDTNGGAIAFSEQKRKSMLSAPAIPGMITAPRKPGQADPKTVKANADAIVNGIKGVTRDGLLSTVGRQFGPETAQALKDAGRTLAGFGPMLGPIGAAATKVLGATPQKDERPVAWDALRADVHKRDSEPPQFASAIEAGSREAANLVLRSRFGGTTKQDPVAANTKRAADNLDKLVKATNERNSARNTPIGIVSIA